MIEWVLVLYLSAGYGGGLTSIPFSKKDECEKNGQYLKAEFTRKGYASGAWYRCIQRTAVGKDGDVR